MGAVKHLLLRANIVWDDDSYMNNEIQRNVVASGD